MNGMQDSSVDKKRRRFLTAAATVVGGAGAIATTMPFVFTLLPSAKTKSVGGPIKVDVSSLNVGERMVVKWRGKPVWILRRNEQSLASLSEMTDKLRDPRSDDEQQPKYAKNEHRSVKLEYLVVVGLCTHLGCSPNYLSKDDKHDLGNDWKGGFFCPCHGSKFDLAGRVFKDVPAPSNLVVPKYQFLSETVLLIGDDTATSLNPTPVLG